MIKRILTVLLLFPILMHAQINTDRVMTIARDTLYFEDYVLSIRYFNQVTNAKPYLYEPYFFRALAKLNPEDFQGAEADCDAAIQRNPFVVGVYQIRDLARIRQGKFDGAIEGYEKTLHYDPENITLRHNLTLSHIQKKNYNAVKEDLESLSKVSPCYTRAYLMKGEVFLQQRDMVTALNDFNETLELDKYDPGAWAARAIVKLQQAKYAKAEADSNRTIPLSTKDAGNYINRTLTRFHQNSLRGAMSDYDLALGIDSNNFTGHYNRGLLRAQVGDDSRAIEDFDFIIKMEPDNMVAVFNRGLLRAQMGDYRGAIQDCATVINQYPNFLAGCHQRSEVRRKIGDKKGTEQDEFKVIKTQIDKQNGVTNKDVTQSKDKESDEEGGEKARKKSDKNMNNYRKTVVAGDSEAEQRYASDYRGCVQDRNVNIILEPIFVLVYYKKMSDVKHSVNFHKYIEDLNRTGTLPKRLRVTDMEALLTEEQVKIHFALIDTHTSVIVEDNKNASKRSVHAIDFYLMQDFSGAVSDLTQTILLDDDFLPAYFMRALIRYKQLEHQKAEQAVKTNAVPGGNRRKEITAVDYGVVRKDLDRATNLAPDFVCAYYNHINVSVMLEDYRAAITDYDKMIGLSPSFTGAHFNRGLTHIFLGNNKPGISDLSKAGELGIISAYNVIRRLTDQSE